MDDIASILDECGIAYKRAGEHHHATHNYLSVNCPWCGDDNFTLGIAISGTHSSCWRCGPHSIQETLKALAGLSYGQVREMLKGIQTELPETVQKRGKLELPQGIKPLNEVPAVKRYLEGRGYDCKALARLWGVKAIGLAARLPWRVFIPIVYHGETVSWTARTISKSKDAERYHSASAEEESVDHKSLLYGEDYARHAVVICEGPCDCWKIGPGAVCTFGTEILQAQVAKMAKYPVRALCLDADKAGRKKAKKLMNELSVFPGETFDIVLESGKDAGEASEKEIKHLRKEILT